MKHIMKDLTFKLLEIPVMKGSEIRVFYDIVEIKVVLDDCKQMQLWTIGDFCQCLTFVIFKYSLIYFICSEMSSWDSLFWFVYFKVSQTKLEFLLNVIIIFFNHGFYVYHCLLNELVRPFVKQHFVSCYEYVQ